MDKNLEKILGFRDPIAPKIKFMRVDELVPYDRNSKAHSKSQIEKIKRSMLEFGWTVPVLADANGIVAGHGRQMAARALYDEGKQISFPDGTPIPIGYVPVLHCDGWDEKRRRAYIIADNQLTMADGWVEDVLKLEVQGLNELGFDLDVLGFDESELDALLAVEPLEIDSEQDPDDAPEIPDVPACRSGDVWICGAHRVAVGDATNPNAWDDLLQGEKVNVVWVDPPYNVDLGRKNKLLDKTLGGERYATGCIANDKMSESEFAEFLDKVFALIHDAMMPGAPIYVAHSDKAGLTFRQAMEKADLHFSQNLVWKKNNLVLGMSDYQNIHEPVAYGWRKGSRHKWRGGRKETTVMEVGEGGPISRDEDGRWLIKVGDSVLVVDGDAKLSESPTSIFHEPKPEKSGLHPSQKPVALVERMLRNSARPNDIVLDCFGGSGTTLVAAERMGMCARIMELDVGFADVIIRRWEHLTGRKAVHAITGEEFPEEGQERDTGPILTDNTDTDVF